MRQAREKGVVVHAVGVGTEAGQPVPEIDVEGRVTGYKRDESGTGRHLAAEPGGARAIALGTGGRTFASRLRTRPCRRWPRRSKDGAQGPRARILLPPQERFQVPLAAGLASLTAGLLLPRAAACGGRRSSRRHRRDPTRAVIDAAAVSAAPLGRQAPFVASPAPERDGRRDRAAPAPFWTSCCCVRGADARKKGRDQYARGNHPQALEAFERASAARPQDPVARFNVADALYKNGKYDGGAAVFRALGRTPPRRLPPPPAHNLGQQPLPEAGLPRRHPGVSGRAAARPGERGHAPQPRAGAARAEGAGGAAAAGNNDSNATEGRPEERAAAHRASSTKRTGSRATRGKQQGSPQPQRPQTPEERADERFRKEAGMPKERAMQLSTPCSRTRRRSRKQLAMNARRRRREGLVSGRAGGGEHPRGVARDRRWVRPALAGAASTLRTKSTRGESVSRTRLQLTTPLEGGDGARRDPAPASHEPGGFLHYLLFFFYHPPL